MSQKNQSFLSKLGNFGIGGAAGIFAVSIIMPVDIVKVRVQILSAQNQPASPIGIAKNIAAKEGIKGFWAGFDAAVARQCFYTTTRFGVFLNLTEYMKESQGISNLPFYQKGLCSIAAGGIGSFVGCPCDVVLIRMQADSMKPVEEQRGYGNVFNAFRRVPAEEGIKGLWSGAVPTMTRAIALNGTLFATYEEVKERVYKSTGNTNLAWYSSSFIAGGAASLTSLPFDNAKTKLQNQVPDKEGRLPYKNIFHCIQLERQMNGLGGLWAGIGPYALKTIPQNMIVLIAADSLRKYFGYI